MDIDILLYLQNVRNALGDFAVSLFEYITHFGGSTLAIIICSVVFWCFSKKLGKLLGLCIISGSIFGQLIKNICCVYRPWIRNAQIIPPANVLEGATGYSFPSLHSLIGISIYGTFALRARKIAFRLLLFAFVLLIGFSRCFLGVHTPQDVLAGLLIGLVFVLLTPLALSFIEKKQKNQLIFFAVGGVLTVAFLVFTTFKSYPLDIVCGEPIVEPKEMIVDCYRFAGMFFGFGCGYILEQRYVNFEICRPLGEKFSRGAVGCALLIALDRLIGLLEPIMHAYAFGFIYTFVLMLYVYVLWPFIFTRAKALSTK